MRIHTKTKTTLVFECEAKCLSGDSWLRFGVIAGEDKKHVEVDKAAMCCDIALNKRNVDTIINWLLLNAPEGANQ